MIVGPTNRLMIPIGFPIFRGQGLNHQFYWYIPVLAMYPINPNHIFCSVKVHPWFSSYGIFSVLHRLIHSIPMKMGMDVGWRWYIPVYPT